MTVTQYFRAMARGLQFWKTPPPIKDRAQLAAFCAQQAAYMAQANLYGYLRTRAGLQHFNLFTDKAFTALLRPARTRLVLVCLADVTLHSAARLVEAGATRGQGEAVAVYVFTTALQELADDALPASDYEAAQADFAARLAGLDWAVHLAPQAFEASTKALIELAPIVDALKNHDTEIVSNSMRFKWLGVRATLAKKLDAPALLASLA